MVFSSVPAYLDPHNWQQHPNQLSGGGGSDNSHLPPPVPLPPPPPAGGGGGSGTGTGTGTGSVRPGSMAERARLAKMAQPEAALNCPRCNSTNTKFCYFNNYSLTQPRHFCKTCRRYWTRGGALRNVPVGGGCRRNKKSKGSRSKSPATNGRHAGSSSTAAVTSTNGCTTDMIGHLLLPPPQQLPLLSSLPHLSDYGSADIALNFAGIQPPSVAATGGVNGGIDMEFQIGSSSSGGGPILSSRFADQWRLQQLHHFPFLTGLEPPSGMYPFEGEGVDPSGYAGGATGQLGSKPLDSGLTQVATVKVEDNQRSNLSRNFLGLPGNDQYWSGNAWTDLSGFTSSSTSHLL